MSKLGIRGWMAIAGVLGWMATECRAEVVQNWSSLGPGSMGTFADKDGSTIVLNQAPGPKPGEKALEMKNHIVSWAGLWSSLDMDLSKTGFFRFMAKSSQPEIVEVALTDRQKVEYTASLRILNDQWKEFVIPLSVFKRGAYQEPEAPPDKPLEWSEIRTLQFLPQTHGDSTLVVGPVSFEKGKAAAETGNREEKNTVTVQDFAFLDKTGYGPYSDGKTGTAVTLSIEGDPAGKGERLAVFHSLIQKGGWAGYWMRAGDVWGGQDWTGAKTFSMEVYTTEPLRFQIAFNDTNQNAYMVNTMATRGTGWERLSVPFGQFKLNPYYQPPGARKGQPLDLTHVETFNLAPQTEGKHDFKVRKIWVEK